MNIRLFDIQNGKVTATEHCYTLSTLKRIMEEYPDTYNQVYTYLYYKTCPDPQNNPFFNVPEEDKEELILSEVNPDFSVEDDLIIEAIAFCNKLYETPTVRAYNGIKSMLDRLAKYLETSEITSGRDGNITALLRAAKDFQDIRLSFKGVLRDLEEEQKTRTRGNREKAYDQ